MTLSRRTRTWRSPGLIALVASLVGTACTLTDTSSDTAIVVSVTWKDGVDPPNVKVLRFYVAREVDPGSGVYRLTSGVPGASVDVAQRDLTTDPYRMLLYGTTTDVTERIQVIVTAEKDAEVKGVGWLVDPEAQAFLPGQIIERTVQLHPASPDLALTWTTSGCLVLPSGDLRFGSAEDQDCDGYPKDVDCDDHDPAVHPGADDAANCDGVDNDCDGTVDNGADVDQDGDGYTPCSGDCDETDPDVHPGAEEICDGKDNDCSGQCDEGFDADGDGYSICGTADQGAGPTGQGQCRSLPYPDCADDDPLRYPGAPEICDGIDNDCDGQCDEGFDADQDGFSDCGSYPDPATDPPFQCVAPNPALRDCADDDPLRHPGAPELCNGTDDNCDGVLGEVEHECYLRTTASDEARCRVGTAVCTESTEGVEFGSCEAGENTLTVPLVYCDAWPVCAQRPDPVRCVHDLIQSFEMTCLFPTDPNGTGPCAPITPHWFTFGFSGWEPGQCHFAVEPQGAVLGWSFGLVEPGQPIEEPNLLPTALNACEAGLVAFPNGEGIAQPSSLVVSFSADDGQGSMYFMKMRVTLGVAATCEPEPAFHCEMP